MPIITISLPTEDLKTAFGSLLGEESVEVRSQTVENNATTLMMSLPKLAIPIIESIARANGYYYKRCDTAQTLNQPNYRL